MKHKTLKLVVVLLGLVTAQFAHATEWSADQYDLYAGDFNGDGKSDILYVAKDPAGISGIAVSDGSTPNTAWQTWPSNYLGIPWSANQYNVIVADFNGDTKSDILLQRATAGDSYLLLADGGGKVTTISQTISSGALGLVWSADQHKIIAGDINNDGRADLFLQAAGTSGSNVVVYTDTSGTFTIAPTQTWADGYLGLKWSTQNANVFIGDFNGDHYSDLLIQAKPQFVMIDYDVTFPVPTYPANMNGIVYSQGGSTPYQLAGVQTWSRMNNGVDWSPLTNAILVGDFNGDGRADVLLQAKNSAGASNLLSGNVSGAAFPASPTPIGSSIPLSADSSKLVVGNFSGGTAAGFYVQALTAAGTNYTANTVGSTITATAHNPNTVMGTSPATAVGHTSGSFAVSNSGAATYSIPIVVPPGVSGVQPSLSIGYQSGGGSALLGVSWGLSGMSEIQRCNKTIVQDGVVGAATLSNTDVYCLDGNRLRLLGGTYGATGSTYQTEMETFARITASPTTAGNGPAYFTVEGKDGLKYEYGKSVDSRIESLNPSTTTTPRVWALNKVSDRAGNTMTITYQEDGSPAGSYRPLEIDYTSNTNAGLTAAYRVMFFWETRPDPITGYVAGGVVRENNRLNRVETQYNDPSVGTWRLVRKYQLSYNTSSISKRSRLSAVQECDRTGNCLSPTSISWQDGQLGFGSEQTTASVGALSANVMPIDINGDGQTDLVYPSGSVWCYMLATGTVYGAATCPPSNAHNDKYASALPIDYNADGRMDILIPNVANQWQVLVFNGTGFDITSTGYAATGAGGGAWTADTNGDGRIDLIYVEGNNLKVRLFDLTTGAFAAVPQTIYSDPDGFSTQVFQLLSNIYRSVIQSADFNGDGKTDLLLATNRHVNIGTGTDLIVPEPLILFSTSSGYTDSGITLTGPSADVDKIFATFSNWRVLDLNGDGVTDLAYPCESAWCVRLGTGTGLGSEVITAAAYTESIAPYVLMTDWDGDGKADLLQAGTSGNWQLLKSTGETLAAAVDTGISAAGADKAVLTDVNGDGQVDIAYADSSGYWHYRLHNGAVPDMATSIADGFGNNVSVTYAPLTDSTVYTKGSGATFPEMDIQAPMYVVKQYSSNDGVGGTTTVNESYSGMRLHLQGRGSEGFASRTETDSRTGIQSTTTFNQIFPRTGTVASVTVKQPLPNGKTISQQINTYTELVTNGTQYADRHYVFPSGSTQYSYEVSTDPAIDGALVKTVTTSGVSVDAYGNTLGSTTQTSSGGQTFTTVTSNAISNDQANWCLGMVTQQQVTNTVPNAMPLAGNATPTRTIKYEYDLDATKCRVYRTTLEPTSATPVVTTFEFDSMGHTNKTTLSAPGIADRVAHVSYGPQGVYGVQFTNAVNEVSYKTYDYALGVPLTATDPNGIQASWSYDDFGRKTRANAPDGTATTWTLASCNVVNGYCGDSLLRYSVTQQQLDGSNSHNVVRTDKQFFDGFNRTLYSQTQTFSGAYSVVRSVYNSKGQLEKRSVPYFAGFSPTYSTNYYDLLGRLLKIERQVSDTDTTLQTVEYTYAKLIESVKDPLNHVTSKTMNAIGQVVQMTDANGSSTTYQYDALGNLAKTTDSAGNQITSTFNLRGFKVASSDPDMGNWSYDYYPSGELKTQTDAKAQTDASRVVTFTYDNISRPKTRTELEGVTTWSYGSSATAHNIGQLDYVCMGTGASCAGQNYREAYTYDSLGRPQNITYTQDTTYQVDYTYNNQGSLDTLTYPTSTAGYRLKLQYAYSTANGQLAQIRDYSAGTQFWTLNATNAANQAVDERMANGVKVISGFDGVSGAIVYRQSGNSGSTSNLQNLSYQWDKAGNLKQRQDVSQNLTEVFGYDPLNRIDNSTLNGAPNLDTDVNAIGNLTKKDDFSSSTYDYTTAQTSVCGADHYYSYSQPHAVRKVGSNVYCYDANGNMTQRAGSTIAWTSYNLPSQINSGSNYSQFTYGPSRQRWKQEANYSGTTETTIYVGGLIEKVTRGTLTEYKHYIAGGSATAIYTRRSDSTTSTYYVTSDHLGSADVITDGTGAAVVRESFAAYGARRGSNWTGSPSAADQTQFTNTTRHGYTGHEMLDNLNLIHMNGRVYDPSIGRFISADPYIQSPMDQQSLNRYSYGSNGPLSGTDPSGYSWLSKLVRSAPPLLRPFAVGLYPGAAIDPTLPFLLVSNYEANKATDRFFVKNPGLQPIASLIAGVVGTIYGQAWVGPAVNAHFTRLNGGSASDILKTFVVSYATNYAFNAAGNISNPVLNTLAQAAIGCGSAAAGGGNCGQGALSAGFGAAYSYSGIGGGLYGAAIAGGIGAELGGGDFAEGARMAGLGYIAGHALQGDYSLRQFARETVDFVGKVWGLPNTVLGIAYGGIGQVVGWAMGTNPKISFGNNAIRFENNPLMESAMTWGNAIVFGTHPRMQPGALYNGHTLGFEEMQHTFQSQVLGPAYFPAHIASGVTGLILDGSWHGQHAFMEQAPHSTSPSPW